MEHSTPPTRAASLFARAWTAFDQAVFRRPDLDAHSRGWEVHGAGRGKRVYRDPRWNSVVVCAECQGTGLAGARTCPDCDGRGTVRLTVADSAGVR